MRSISDTLIRLSEKCTAASLTDCEKDQIITSEIVNFLGATDINREIVRTKSNHKYSKSLIKTTTDFEQKDGDKMCLKM